MLEFSVPMFPTHVPSSQARCHSQAFDVVPNPSLVPHEGNCVFHPSLWIASTLQFVASCSFPQSLVWIVFVLWLYIFLPDPSLPPFLFSFDVIFSSSFSPCCLSYIILESVIVLMCVKLMAICLNESNKACGKRWNNERKWRTYNH